MGEAGVGIVQELMLTPILIGRHSPEYANTRREIHVLFTHFSGIVYTRRLLFGSQAVTGSY
jgi:hypothetical protein